MKPCASTAKGFGMVRVFYVSRNPGGQKTGAAAAGAGGTAAAAGASD